MKKYISAIAVVALLASTGVAQAYDHKERGGENERIQFEKRNKFGLLHWNKEERRDKFVVLGTVTAKTDTNLTLTVQADNRSEINGSVVVVLNTDTKYKSGRNAAALVDVLVGNRVAVSGQVNNSVYTAAMVQLMPLHQPKVMGEVVAKTDTSITIKNNVTGEEKVVTLEDDTKIKINGEIQTSADVQLGDRGWIKLKSSLTTAVAKVISLFR